VARLRRAPVVAADGVPVPLKDRHAAFWFDSEAVADLALQEGLPGPIADPRTVEKWPLWRRFDVFRTEWCESVGMVNAALQCPDYAAMRAAGIDMSGSGRLRLVES